MRVAVYERVSSDAQREKETIKSQTDCNARFLAGRPELLVVGQYRDDGVSGALPLSQRPQGARLMADAIAGVFEALVVTRADRLGRDAIDLMQVRAFFERLEIQLIGSVESLDDEMQYDFLAVFAKHDRKRFLKRSREGMERAAREGRFCGGIVPFGYVVPEKKEKARLVPDTMPFWEGKSTAEIVVWIFEMIGIEKLTPMAVSELLNTLQVPTHYQKDGRLAVNPRRGKRQENTDGKWRSSRVRALVLNTVYKGVYRYGKNPPKRKDGTKPIRAVLEGPCERLVSDELWLATKDSISSRRTWDPTQHKKHLLRSLVVCAHCGLNYSGGSSHGKPWYRCNGRMKDNIVRRGPCFGQALDGSIIEPLIQRDICDFLLFPGDVLEDLAYELQDEPGQAVDETERLMLESRIEGVGARRKRAIQLNLSGLISTDELTEQLGEIDRDKEVLEKRLAEIPVKRGPKPDRPVVAEDLLAQLVEKVEEGFSEDQWRDLVTLLVKRVAVLTKLDGDAVTQRVVVEYNFAPQNEFGVVPNRTDMG